MRRVVVEMGKWKKVGLGSLWIGTGAPFFSLFFLEIDYSLSFDENIWIIEFGGPWFYIYIYISINGVEEPWVPFAARGIFFTMLLPLQKLGTWNNSPVDPAMFWLWPWENLSPITVIHHLYHWPANGQWWENINVVLTHGRPCCDIVTCNLMTDLINCLIGSQWLKTVFHFDHSISLIVMERMDLHNI